MTENFSPPDQTPAVRYYVTLLLALLALTGLLDIGFGEAERPINIHHIIAVLGLTIFFTRGRIVLPPPAVNIFFATLFVVSGIAALQHGVHMMMLNSVYCFYLCFLGLICGHLLSRAALLSALRVSAWIVLGAITVKNIFYAHDILDILSTMSGRVFIPSVVAGGTNIEATFALFAAAFLRGSRGYWLALAYALFLAVLYSSRAAMLGVVALFAYEVLVLSPTVSLLQKQFRTLGLVAAALAVVLLLFSAPIAQFALSRFQDIGYEPGSQGRLVMWETAPGVFLHHPLGVGAGNGIHETELALGHNLEEDNLHNIYLQILVDLGMFGFIAYAMMIYAAAQRGIAARDFNPLWLAIGLYFFMGILQFRAYDPFMFFWLGLAWHEAPPESVTQ